jgi:PAT family beta-lactamase induction signal transducer AmpG
VNAGTGVIVERIGWFNFYLLCTVLALPGMLLLLKVAPWNDRTGTQQAGHSSQP